MWRTTIINFNTPWSSRLPFISLNYSDDDDWDYRFTDMNLEFDDYLVNVAPFLFAQAHHEKEQTAVDNMPTSDNEFKTADANKDNKLNFEEFLHKDPYHLKLVVDEFKKFDANSE